MKLEKLGIKKLDTLPLLQSYLKQLNSVPVLLLPLVVER